MSTPLNIAEFTADLRDFGIEAEADAERVFRSAAQTAAEALVVGNAYGPGAPVDTGFLQNAFRVGIGRAKRGPTTRPARVQSGKGKASFANGGLGPEIATATLDKPVYVTTNVVYAEPLENTPKTRRFGPHQGQSTVFVRVVEMRWTRILEDTMRRLGIGDPSGSVR